MYLQKFETGLPLFCALCFFAAVSFPIVWFFQGGWDKRGEGEKGSASFWEDREEEREKERSEIAFEGGQT
jgi:hypothetical protein